MSSIFEPDKSGINSLGGFSYQIRVFAYHLIKLENNMQLEFEIYEDVSLSKVDEKDLDASEEKFKSILNNSNGTTAIQVKRTAISKDVAQKILLNWILLEGKVTKISRYILFTEESYGNKDIIFSLSCRDLFNKVEETEGSKNSIIRKVKDLYDGDYECFEKVYESIKSKYSFEEKKDIDEEIAEGYKILFKRDGVNDKIVYYQRIKALLERVTYEIMVCMGNKEPYIMDYNKFMKLTERISIEITDDDPIMDYISFKKSCAIDTKDAAINKLREFKQLNLCGLPNKLIQRHLIYSFYYNHFQITYTEMNKITKIENIEETAYENYEDALLDLMTKGNDTPQNRLDNTKKRDNSYASNEQIKYGAIVHLTKEGMGDKQISWKDEE
ncbi:hypothetical protein [Planococcus sp. 4-30]|uniref:hypothetical protein n=1 Tax=Planococcus sp. 4-30 TaxID=2874583 RepID=UPI001CC13560|nr:hypothetical protein [Planococcus sp. 4-30]